jgi:Zn-dependent peptidase ImmA (M78 family)
MMPASPLYQSPIALLQELGIAKPEEIHLEGIAEHCGATIVYRRTVGCEARVLGYGDRAIITVNEAAPVGRRRFSAAHELGHWLLDRGTVSLTCTEDTLTREWSDETIERRANRYAADLLLPDFMVRPIVQDYDITFAMVEHLIDQFNTSFTTTAIRLVELGSFPAILICSEAGKRRWFFRSGFVPQSFWPYAKPRPGTATFDVLHRPFEKGLVRNLTGESWIGHPTARNQPIREEAIRLTPRLVLSLITW